MEEKKIIEIDKRLYLKYVEESDKIAYNVNDLIGEALTSYMIEITTNN